MRTPLRVLALALAGVMMATFSSDGLHAQAMSGRQLGTNRVSVSYYMSTPIEF
ncbi:MAG: hypothetical protein IRZ28_21145 [Steroidobacteraceae bacterium]|nr:hypothetical protein [Steroidobacteraceae bacterium]